MSTRSTATALVLSLGLVLAPAASAYVLVATEGGTPIRWEQICIPWYLHEAGSDDVTGAEAEDALVAAFETWNAVDAIYPDFQALGITCFEDVGLADWPGIQNVVQFRDDPGTWAYESAVVALTSVTFNTETGVIAESDLEFNGENFTFAVDGRASAYDLQAAATHEVGHFLGLGHSEDPDATMNKDSGPGETDKRTLEADDIAGASVTHSVDDPPEDTTPCDASATVSSFDDPFCPEEPANDGCAGAGGRTPLAVALALLAAAVLLARRRRATTLALLLCLGTVQCVSAGDGDGGFVWTPPAANACSFYLTDDGMPLLWRTGGATYVLDDDIPEELAAEDVEHAFEVSFATWTELECLDFEIASEGWDSCPGEDKDDGVNCVYWTLEPELWPFEDYLVAVTLVHFDTSTGEILDVDMNMNAAFTTYSADPHCEFGQPEHDLRATVTHEAGHFLGLDHTSVTDATMNAVTFAGDCKKRTLHADDELCLCETYLDPPPLPDDSGGDSGGEDVASTDPADASGGDSGSGGDTSAPPGNGGCMAGGPGASGLVMAWMLLVAAALRRTSVV